MAPWTKLLLVWCVVSTESSLNVLARGRWRTAPSPIHLASPKPLLAPPLPYAGPVLAPDATEPTDVELNNTASLNGDLHNKRVDEPVTLKHLRENNFNNVTEKSLRLDKEDIQDNTIATTETLGTTDRPNENETSKYDGRRSNKADMIVFPDDDKEEIKYKVNIEHQKDHSNVSKLSNENITRNASVTKPDLDNRFNLENGNFKLVPVAPTTVQSLSYFTPNIVKNGNDIQPINENILHNSPIPHATAVTPVANNYFLVGNAGQTIPVKNNVQTVTPIANNQLNSANGIYILSNQLNGQYILSTSQQTAQGYYLTNVQVATPVTNVQTPGNQISNPVYLMVNNNQPLASNNYVNNIIPITTLNNNVPIENISSGNVLSKPVGTTSSGTVPSATFGTTTNIAPSNLMFVVSNSLPVYTLVNVSPHN